MQVVLKAAVAAGHLCFGSPEADTLEPAVDALVGLATNKAEEVQFAAGEALCHMFGGECLHIRRSNLLFSCTFKRQLLEPRLLTCCEIHKPTLQPSLGIVQVPGSLQTTCFTRITVASPTGWVQKAIRKDRRRLHPHSPALLKSRFRTAY